MSYLSKDLSICAVSLGLRTLSSSLRSDLMAKIRKCSITSGYSLMLMMNSMLQSSSKPFVKMFVNPIKQAHTKKARMT